APPAARHDQLLPVLDQLAQQLARVHVAHHRARRHAQHQARTVPARAVLPLPVLAALRPVMLLVAVVQQRGELAVRAKDDVAAAPAITARGPAARHALLAPERLRARAARPAVHVDDRVVNEHLYPIPGPSALPPRPSAFHPSAPPRRPRRRCGYATAPTPAPTRRAPCPRARVQQTGTRSRAPPRHPLRLRPRSAHRAGGSEAVPVHPAAPASRPRTAPVRRAPARAGRAPCRSPPRASTPRDPDAARPRARAAARTALRTPVHTRPRPDAATPTQIGRAHV